MRRYFFVFLLSVICDHLLQHEGAGVEENLECVCFIFIYGPKSFKFHLLH